MPAAEPPVSLLRPALELAWAVAKIGSQGRPPQPVPGRLRPLMKATRLPDRMLGTVREVLQADESFRERVVKAADEEFLGRAAWLWLVQPEGWEEELGGLVEEAEKAGEEAEEKRISRATQRQLEEANAALHKVRAEMVSIQTLNSQLEIDLSAARKARRDADDEAARVRVALEQAVAGQDELRGTAADLAARIKRLEAELSGAAERVTSAEMVRDEARREVDVLNLALAEAQRQAASFRAEAEALRRMLEDVFVSARDAASAAGVDTTGQVLTQPPPQTGASGSDLGSAPATTATPLPRRVPAALPPAIFEESPEAAQYLVRLPGAVLVVDGYNVTLSSWPGADLPMQRRRLVDALGELAMRAGTEVVVIFDGVDDGNRLQLPSSVRGRMRVRFTASEVEADEVIIDLVRSLPLQRAVVVATNDRRVRDGANLRGANVITVDQLLAVIGRGPSPSP